MNPDEHSGESRNEESVTPNLISTISESLIHITPDEILAMLCNATNSTEEGGFPIVLHVSGLLVSGTMISGNKYFNLLADVISQDEPKSGNPENVSDVFREMASTYYPKNEDPATKIIPVYIHLQDAAIWTPGVKDPIKAALWRGRLSQVSAWSLGNLTATPS